MDVLFLSPGYPPEMNQFTRGLAEVGARVWGVGDSPSRALPDVVRRSLSGYLQVPSMLDEDDVIGRVRAWVGGRIPDRVEGNWEPVTLLAARLRELMGVDGMSVDAVLGFRDKVLMRQRVEAAGLSVPRTRRVHSVRGAWAAAEELGFPLIIKPIAGAGSADTFRVDDARAFEAALAATRHVPELSIEEFITGDEYTYETICVRGEPAVESVCRYHPNTLIARQNEWISPIIQSHADLTAPEVAPGVALGRAALVALGMGTGFTHMEWFRTADGRAVFGEVACRAPGANMVDLMNYTFDADLFRAWGEAVARGEVAGPLQQRWSAAIVFKRARGQGRIRAIEGLGPYLQRYRPHVARVDLLPIGAPRRDWKQTFLSDGNLVVRSTSLEHTLDMARQAAASIHLFAG
ncbi:MAG TPA: ATP-grasp domain-containing protein [Myxococcota bacterium]|nr:ATP-grasp domain-containing protein [Myxococcota bacterium]